MKEFAKKMKDNLDQWKRFQRRIKGRFEKADKADDDLEKSEALDELKELNDKIKMKIYWINWISLNRKVKPNTELEQLVELTKKYYVEKEGRTISG
jgi:hypothetical protein